MAIIGADIVGVSTTYELALLGHEVTVFERRSSVAEAACFANAGVVAPGYTGPWAAPDMRWKVVRALLSTNAPMRLGVVNALARLPWMWRWWRACRPSVHIANRTAMLRLAQSSQAWLQGLTRELRLEFDQAPAFMVLLRSERDLKAAMPNLALLQQLGVAHEVIDAARCLRIEPGLHRATPLHAVLHLPQDGVGNCRQFAHLLKAHAQRLGANFRFDADVKKILPGSTLGEVMHGAPDAVLDNVFNAVVVCAGPQANRVLSGVGVRLPLASVHAYSVTAPLRHVDGMPPPGPRAAAMDERYQTAISRLGATHPCIGPGGTGRPPGPHSRRAVAHAGRLVPRRSFDA